MSQPDPTLCPHGELPDAHTDHDEAKSSHWNWEGVGVVPDILISAENARSVAYLMALLDLGANKDTPGMQNFRESAGFAGRGPELIDSSFGCELPNNVPDHFRTERPTVRGFVYKPPNGAEAQVVRTWSGLSRFEMNVVSEDDSFIERYSWL
jgi:hypothetical protein